MKKFLTALVTTIYWDMGGFAGFGEDPIWGVATGKVYPEALRCAENSLNPNSGIGKPKFPLESLE